MRTHYCGQVTETLEAQTVTVSGWVHRRRDHGGVIFIDLRDREGLVQIVVNPDDAEMFAIAERVRSEFVLKVEGSVCLRTPETINPKMATGKIEIVATSLEVLSKSEPIPFQLDDKHISEEVRLTYRYLDLRRDEMQQVLRTRYNVTRSMRRYLDDNEFMDIETPILTKSTPEGARD